MIWKPSRNACGLVTAGFILTAASLRYSVYAGERANDMQKRGIDRQRAAQQTAQDAAIRQQKLSAEAYAKANAKTPDIGSILAAEQELSKTGAASTQLTTPGPKKKPVGQTTTLLGE